MKRKIFQRLKTECADGCETVGAFGLFPIRKKNFSLKAKYAKNVKDITEPAGQRDHTLSFVAVVALIG